MNNNLEKEIKQYFSNVFNGDTCMEDIASYFAQWQKSAVMEHICEFLKENLVLECDYPHSTDTLINNLRKEMEE